MNELTPLQQKVIDITQSIINTAGQITGYAKQLPKDKLHKNIFKKNYHRRPSNKKKAARAKLGMAMAAFMGANQVRIIQSQPIPKFKKGGISLGYPALVNQFPADEFTGPNSIQITFNAKNWRGNK